VDLTSASATAALWLKGHFPAIKLEEMTCEFPEVDQEAVSLQARYSRPLKYLTKKCRQLQKY